MAKKALERWYATGKRKTSVARVWIRRGEGKVTINRRTLEDYLPRETNRLSLLQPFAVTETAGQFDVSASAGGGGLTGQTEAIRHGIARALCAADPEHRVKLKRAGLLTRDARIRERKKYGQPGARKRFQYSKR